MKHTNSKTVAFNMEKLLTAQRNSPSPNSSLVSEERADTNNALSVFTLMEQCRREIHAYRCGEPSHEAYSLELMRWAIMQGNQDAWAGLQQILGEIMLEWLKGHPYSKTACRLESEEHYVALAFERFWQATVNGQVRFETLAGVLAYLRASLNGAILDMLRTYWRPQEVLLSEPGGVGEPSGEDLQDSSEIWNTIQTLLPHQRERRLAYLLFHCGLGPREIVHVCPGEWSDIQEIYHLRRNILERWRRMRANSAGG